METYKVAFSSVLMMLVRVVVMMGLVIRMPTTIEACFGGGGNSGGGSLRVDAYQSSCPDAEAIIFSWVVRAVSDDPRMAASLLRLHFHDCFVNGCDASVLLDDTEMFVGEKTAAPNANSLRGFDVIDSIKSELESVCPQTVSCADILAILARDSVLLSGGPGWEVQLGRRDSLTASKAAANNNIPGPNSDVATLVTKFQDVGLTLNDMIALSGAHTIGKAKCSTFSSSLIQGIGSGGDGGGDSFGSDAPPALNLDFLSSLQHLCLESGNATLVSLDLMTPATFDNQYYINLISGEGLLPSDNALVAGGNAASVITREIVEGYANDPFIFFQDFKTSMLKMGSLKPLTGNNGQIRRNCRSIN
ncbi:peroxidase 40-like [Telopea speciosissima]|uniref:peroxidase 40-like n=1 Tax=Telopea speciosissima TaxID=54955 RepID=UPI001CC3C486|nr:peroxidase 40-like [Telopea speciosissima]